MAGNVLAGKHVSDTGTVNQRYHAIGKFDGQTPVIGSWMIIGYAAGIGIREDSGFITGNDSRFVPPFLGQFVLSLKQEALSNRNELRIN